MAKNAEFAEVFEALREILQRQAGQLSVAEDSSSGYCLEDGLHPKHKKPMPVAWVRVGSGYVSFHHMGVYAHPELLSDVSEKLRGRMQSRRSIGRSLENWKR